MQTGDLLDERTGALVLAESGSPKSPARRLAAEHAEAQPSRTGPILTDDLPLYREVIQRAVHYFRNATSEEVLTSYAAEWLLDNDFLIIQALRLIEKDLPDSFARQLPRLADSWPRSYAIAHHLVLSGCARLDLEALGGYIGDYQQVTPLTMGELWALPIMLRFAVVQAQVQAAAELTKNEKRLAAQVAPKLDWPDGTAPDDLIANGFISLRVLAAADWKVFFESQSLVERELRRDPTRTYDHMDFETRDRYRKVVEALAAATNQPEFAVAEAAVALAQAALPSQADRLTGDEAHAPAHVGYYLLDRGRGALEQRIGYQPAGKVRLRRWTLEHPALTYLGSIGLLTGAVLALLAIYVTASGATAAETILAVMLAALPVSSLAIHWVNWAVTHALRPRLLPKMEFREGIPTEHAALVVIPSMLSTQEDFSTLLSQLEQHYLRNPDGALFFALATDFTDSPAEEMPEDADLLHAATDGIERLNRRYPRADGADRFLLFHRPRRWNAAEGVWMGWERKRGKLHQLNQLILAVNRKEPPPPEVTDAFSVQVGRLEKAPALRYVITLDTDTILPIGAAARLVAAHAHPLNQPQIAPDGSVTTGYSILQPRTEISPVSSNNSMFTRIFSGDTGLDLYTLAVSDVYQDLFGEGIYVGKGIYHVESFESGLADRAPENTLLSHDLFEGVHGRVGLITDVVLIESYPSHYLVHAGRIHRWIRGDWQLLPWLLRRAPGMDRRRLSDRLSIIDRWKIFDNLRRSLVDPSLIFLLTMSWFGVLPGAPIVWTLLAVLSLAGPLFTEVFNGMIHYRRTARTSGDGKTAPQVLFASARNTFLRWLLAIVFLLYEAGLIINAILVTLFRLFISRRKLLNWTTAAQTEQRFREAGENGLVWGMMIEAPLSAVVLATGCLLLNPDAIWAALPLLAAWLASPHVALWISRPILRQTQPLDDEDRATLRRLARRTWLFFEQFVGPEDSWLPPDHFQESPLGVVAHRTSPTNIGLNLLASLGAYDLGYTGLLGLAAGLQNSIETLQRLERYRGHFLNWYDTRNLEPLPPSYVSTVDSGNLAACLLALSQGLQSLDNMPVLRWQTFSGIWDTLSLLEGQLRRLPEMDDWQSGRELFEALDSLQTQIAELEDRPQEWGSFLLGSLFREQPTSEPAAVAAAAWKTIQSNLVALLDEYPGTLDAETLRRLRQYVQQAHRCMETAQREIRLLHPWLAAVAHPPASIEKAAPAFQAAWESLLRSLLSSPNLGQVDEFAREVQRQLQEVRQSLPSESNVDANEVSGWCDRLEASLEQGVGAIQELRSNLNILVAQAEAFFGDMDFAFLYDSVRQVFHIGYNHALGRLDDNYYDLLASEARIASLVAIAKGDVPPRHWLHLARPMTEVNGQRVLLSWSATMFEYLMPTLLLRPYPNTLLEHSSAAAVDVQIAYGQAKKTPWGISESGYYRFDSNQTYQYRAFGVPGLGYKRGLADDLVITPYASLLAMPYRPKAVVENVVALEKLGGLGTYGLYEAVDFTAERLQYGSEYEVVREYMAHHQGMIFLSLVNYFCENIFVQRFHADPRIQSVELLLQEQIPNDVPVEEPHLQETHALRPEQPQVVMTPWRARVNAPQPRVHVLTNGRFSSVLTAAGGGYSVWKDIDLTRWRADGTLGEWGQWVYVQDLQEDRVWSIGYLPTAVQPQHRDVYFHPHRVVYNCRHEDITAEMNVTISPDDDVEIRQIDLINHSDQPRRMRVISYGEVILTAQASDRRHPAFNKLFIRSEWVGEANALLFHRRQRSKDDEIIFMGHALVSRDTPRGPLRYESDRRRFIGRGGTIRAPQFLSGEQDGSGATGATLDPIFSVSQEYLIPANGAIRLALLTVVALTREQVLASLERFRSWPHLEHTFERARAEAEMELRQIGLHTPQLVRIQHLLSGLLYSNARLRAPAEVLQANRKGQSGLWAYAISGDYPILLVKLNSPDELDLAQDMILAHLYWRRRQLKIDLVFLNEQGVNYGQELHGNLQRMLVHSGSDVWLNQRGGIFIIPADRLNDEDRILLETMARVVLNGKLGGLEKHLPSGERLPSRLPAFIPHLTESMAEETPELARPQDWLFDNGLGGFSPDGKEYQIYLEPGRLAPSPWVNVIANREFGFLTSEAGLGFSWAANSGENRLTPWSNDPVVEPSGEAVYLRDEETGVIWSPTPLPAGGDGPTLVRHGFGYTFYEHNSHGLEQRLRVFVAGDAPVKIIHMRLKNARPDGRRITVTYYAEWVLGVTREEMGPYIIPEYDGDTQALLARNPYLVEFGERVAFAAASKRLHGLTADRTEFLGRMGDQARPAGLKRIGLAGVVEAGRDPCAALQLHIDLAPGGEEQVYFLLGQAEDREAALELVRRFQQAEEVERAWTDMQAVWKNLVSTVQVKTPDPAMDLVLNGWLFYQALACRIWGRSAFYQSSGAYGFRDQLQDVMALVFAAPDVAREHLLRSAGRQFDLGDVLHWWHPPSGRGVRTRFSDDLLWLPFVSAYYVNATGDDAVLDEIIPFLKGPPLKPDQDENYGEFPASTEEDSLYEHCRRAIEKGSTHGLHGLPLMGSGDWNDGMNRVGNEGQGESVWLAWFLIDTLRKFAEVCDRRGDGPQANVYRERASDYARAVEQHAWDGEWYRRAYYDDGTPLGSKQNRECQIDSIAQSWAILSAVGDPQRQKQAMQSVVQRLIRPQDRLALLFAPPFNRTLRDPGYIKGYPPGVRENGGQYTHASVWTVWALAQLGEGNQAHELFSLLNPIYHSETPEKMERYMVEPYVIAADVYGAEPHTGRGGWTWYTGSAGWMYRLGLEAILGLHRKGGFLCIDPCIPAEWPGFKLSYRNGDAVLEIQVENPQGVQRGVSQVMLDGKDLPDGKVPLLEDGQKHSVRIIMGRKL